jgi:hypothetical protein
MKKGPLSKSEKKYISENVDETAVTVMATSLDRSTSIVQKYVDTLSTLKDTAKRFLGTPETSVATTKKEPVEQTTKKEPTGQTSNLFARNKERGVTIMTENASIAADESKAKRKEAANGVPRYKKHIHTIK